MLCVVCPLGVLSTDVSWSLCVQRSGLQAQLVGITPEKALKLTSNQFFVNMIAGKAGRELTFAEQVLAGALTGCVQVVSQPACCVL